MPKGPRLPTIAANGLTFSYETAGDPKAPVILLIMGLGTQLIAWPDDFVAGLAEAGYHVIRYDNRDIGQSTYLDGARAGHPLLALAAKRFGLPFPVAYSLRDMAADSVALMDALDIGSAHVVGASMGGMIAQIVAADYPARVRSLTSIMSSSGAPGLPLPTAALRRRLLARRPANAGREQLLAMGEDTLRSIAYPDPARPESAYRAMAERALDRGFNPAGVRRHLLAIIDDGSRVDRLKRIAAPTLVIHGKADQLVPIACGVDTARHIPGARFEAIDAMAHDMPPSQVPTLIALIGDHARAADGQRLAA